MALAITCPSCGYQGRVPTHYQGMRIKCRQCQTAFTATPPSDEDEATAFLSEEEAAQEVRAEEALGEDEPL